MSFNWVDYLTLAKELKASAGESGTSEACYRSAASRAYYAAFHLVFHYACNNGYSPSYDGYDHIAIIKFLRQNSSSKDKRKIALELERLKDSRRRADYDDEISQSLDIFAEIAIGYAKGILNKLDTIRGPSP